MRTDHDKNIHGITYISVVIDGGLKANPLFPYSTPYSSHFSPFSAKINHHHPSRLIFFFLFVALFHWPIYLSTGRRHGLGFISFTYAPGLPHNHRAKAITLGIYKFVFLYCGSFESSDHFTLENSVCTSPINSFEQISSVILVTRPNWICKTATSKWQNSN